MSLKQGALTVNTKVIYEGNIRIEPGAATEPHIQVNGSLIVVEDILVLKCAK